MWVFTTSGMASAVQHADDASRLMVRFRDRRDAETFAFACGLSSSDVIDNVGSDYAFRIFVDRETFADVARDYIMQQLNYTNFKDAATKAHAESLRPNRECSLYRSWLHNVWDVGFDYQQATRVDEEPGDYFRNSLNTFDGLEGNDGD